MEIHPPEHPIHTWRDFTIHIATIVVGLLIAIGLEQSVEWLHHRHLRHTAEHNLAIELTANRKTLAEDEKQLEFTVVRLREGMRLMEAMRKDPAAGKGTNAQWQWNDLASAAWDTAQATNATGLMSYDEAQSYADLYAQQRTVNVQAGQYIRTVYKIGVPVELGKKLSEVTPDDIDRMQAAVRDSIAEVSYLLDLCHSLDGMYADHHV